MIVPSNRAYHPLDLSALEPPASICLRDVLRKLLDLLSAWSLEGPRSGLQPAAGGPSEGRLPERLAEGITTFTGRAGKPAASSAPGGSVSPARSVKVAPLRQSNSSSCGQTSAAMAINALTGKKLTDRDIQAAYGYGLLNALRRESRSAGYTWKDGGDFSKDKWALIDRKTNREKTPVMIGLNGPRFSPSGRGHIVLILGSRGDRVTYSDPADGRVKTCSRRDIETAGRYPQGNFIFYASRNR